MLEGSPTKRRLWLGTKVAALLLALACLGFFGYGLYLLHHPERLLGMARSFQQRGDLDRAEYFARQALSASRGSHTPAEAESLFALAEYGQQRQQYSEARDYLEQVRAMAHGRAQMRFWEAIALTGLGNLDLATGWYDKAEANLLEARDLWKAQTEQKARFWDAIRQDKLGQVYLETARYAEAVREFQEALQIPQSDPDDLNMVNAVVRPDLAKAYGRTGELDKALEQMQPAVEGADSLGQSLWGALAQKSLGETYMLLGMPSPAAEMLQQAHQLLKTNKLPRYEAETASELSSIFFVQGKYPDSLRYAQEALPLASEQHMTEVYALTLNTLAADAGILGEYAEAITLLRDVALPLFTATGSEFGHAITLENLGWLSNKTGQNAAALGYYQQAIQDRIKLKDLAAEAQTRASMGMVELQLSESEDAQQEYYRDEAQSEFSRAEKILAQYGGDPRAVGGTLNNIGLGYAFSSRYADSLPFFEKAAANLQKAGDAYTEITARLNSAFVQDRLKHYAPAIANTRRAEDLVEQLRGGLRDPTARMGLLVGVEDAPRFMAGLLAKLAAQSSAPPFPAQLLRDAGSDYASAALNYAERGKARALLDLLARSSLYASRLPKELAHREKLLLAAQNAALEDPGKRRFWRKQSQQSFYEATKKLDEFVASLRNNGDLDVRRYAALRYPQPAQTEAVQHALNNNEVLLEYVVCDDETLLFIVRPRGPVEIKHVSRTAKDFANDVPNLLRNVKGAGDATELHAKLEPFYNELLAPALENLGSDTRLILVPDEQLFLLPFEMFGHGDTPQSWKYMGEERTVSYYPSATVLVFMREKAKAEKETRRHNTQRWPLFAVGDASYDVPPTNAPTNRKLRETLSQAGVSFSALPHSREEVSRIATAFGIREPSPHLLLGPDASESRIKDLSRKKQLLQYENLVFSTHGVLSVDAPGLDQPALVLSQLPDGKEDGFLTMDEAFGLELDAGLVVLSACDTGRGKRVHGEGVIGLTRAFFYAGAQSVVVSLWQVDDESTATLMEEFYTGMQHHLNHADALRTARQKLLSSNDKSKHPYYWAPFILVGD